MGLHRTEFHQLLSRAKSCLLNVSCAMMEGSRVIGTLCPSVTDGQIGEKHRDMGQWSNLLVLFTLRQLQANQAALGPGRGQRTATSTLVEVLEVARMPLRYSALTTDDQTLQRKGGAQKKRTQSADLFVPVPFFDSVCSTVVSILLT